VRRFLPATHHFKKIAGSGFGCFGHELPEFVTAVDIYECRFLNRGIGRTEIPISHPGRVGSFGQEDRMEAAPQNRPELQAPLDGSMTVPQQLKGGTQQK
jgi:hypothetical protein